MDLTVKESVENQFFSGDWEMDYKLVLHGELLTARSFDEMWTPSLLPAHLDFGLCKAE